MSEPKITLTLTFESRADLAAYLAGEATPADDEGEVSEPATRTDATVDGDGMPYDAEIHSAPPFFTAAGLWRSKKGKAAQADAARAAFKAKGGPLAAAPAPAVAPAVAPVVAPVAPAPVAPAPVAPAPVANLGLPAIGVARAPVTMEMVAERINGAMNKGTINADGVNQIYAHVGVKRLADLDTNESLRAALYDALAPYFTA